MAQRLENVFSGSAYTYLNITDPKICYNVDQFDEHKDILDCGFAKVKFIYKGKTYNIQTCYFMPDSKLKQNFQDFFRIMFLENEFENLADYVYDAENNDEDEGEDENEDEYSYSFDVDPDITIEEKKKEKKSI